MAVMNLRERLKIHGWSGTFSPLVVAITILIVLSLISFLLYLRLISGAEPYKAEYEGEIVDKSLTVRESETRPGVQFLLLVKGNDGDQFNVSVSRDLYQDACVGMHIKKTRDGTFLDK
jgi:hypothetical protein